MTILKNAIYRFNVISIKLPMAFFKELGKKNSQFIWKHKRLKKSWERRIGTGGINLPDFRLHCKTTIIKTVWYWHKNRNIDQWNKTKPRNKPMHLWVTYFWQRRQEYIMGKDSLFNKWCWEKWRAMCKRMKLEHLLMPYTKIKSKWIKNLLLDQKL